MSLNIHWLCNVPSPYNEYLFQSLAADPEINLTVHFQEKNVSSHPWTQPMTQGFPSRFAERRLGLDWKLIDLAIHDKSSIFIVSGWNHPSRWVLFIILIFLKKPYILWTDTPDFDKPRMWLKDALRTNGLTWIFRSALAIMGTGGPGVEVLIKMGAPKEKTVNFPLWVPLPQKTNNERTISDNSRITFFSIGRLDPIKGYDLAIKAFETVAATRHREKFEFWIFGDGPERSALELMVNKTGMTDIVTFWGWQEPSFIQDKIQEADILVHPALWEPYGVVVLEAMALGKLVLGSDNTMAMLDRIVHNVNGLIHRTGDVKQLSEDIIFFIENPDRILSMGREARQTAEKWPIKRGIDIIKGIAHQETVQRM